MDRKVDSVWSATPTIEGAGVHLKRAFGQAEVPRLDPFLLLDDFSSENPADYLAGFPWHPHRGIETVTYILKGRVDHEDSLGNKGSVGKGDVQWMSAGSGIVHQEMPKEAKELKGFQLWVNLPQTKKMMDPRYQDVSQNEIPIIDYNNAKVKIVCGNIGKNNGPVQDLMVKPEFLDIEIKPYQTFNHNILNGKKAFAYMIDGNSKFENYNAKTNDLVIFKDGDNINLEAGSKGARMLLISGKPLNEKIAWYGPVVMNSESELRKAFSEYQQGKFIKTKPKY